MSDWDWDWLLKGSGLRPEDFMAAPTPIAPPALPPPGEDASASQVPLSAYGVPIPVQSPSTDDYDDQATGQFPASGTAQPGAGQANGSATLVGNEPGVANSVGQANGSAQPAPDMAPQAPPPKFTTSSAGVQFIQIGEGGYKNRIYPDATGNPTFGWGHKLSASEEDSLSKALPNMTEDQKRLLATAFLHDDLRNAEQIVHQKLGPAVHSLSQNQFDALVSDTFNAGYNGALGKTMIGAIRSGNFPAAGQQFNAFYGHVNGQRIKIDGLERRNQNEAALFNNGDYSRPF